MTLPTKSNSILGFPIPVLRQDIVASLGVFVVAVPLSLGIALASGLEPGAGLVAAFIGGVVVGLLSGAPLVVSGPAAGLAALVFQFVQEFGVQGLLCITLMAGLMQILMGVARLGKIFTMVPTALLKGMLAAIGLIIAFSQIHVLLGGSVPKSPVASLSTFPEVLSTQLASQAGLNSLGLGALAILIIHFWPKISGRWSTIPGALPAIVLVTLVAIPLTVDRVVLGSIFGSGIENAKNLWTWAIWDNAGIYLGSAVGLAIIASAETLLTAKAVDTLPNRPADVSKTDLNKELLAQGTGNMISAAMGAMPITGVIVRSAANVQFGAQSRLSTILHGLWIALFVLTLPNVLAMIPLTGLAAILIVTGFKLLDLKGLRATFAKSTQDGIVWLTTIVAIVTTNLLTGLLIALGVSLIIYRNSILPIAQSKMLKLGLRKF